MPDEYILSIQIRRVTMNLSVKILISLVLSVIVGLMAGVDGLPFIKWWIAPVGTIFINLI